MRRGVRPAGGTHTVSRSQPSGSQPNGAQTREKLTGWFLSAAFSLSTFHSVAHIIHLKHVAFLSEARTSVSLYILNEIL